MSHDQATKPGTPFTADLTDTAATIAALAAAAGVAIPSRVRGFIIAAPTATTNAGTIFHGNATAQILSVGADETTGIYLAYRDPDSVYIRSSEASGDKVVIQPII